MPYVEVDTSVPRQRKFIKAGPEACWLWLSSTCYCQEALTDGHIPEEVLDALGVKNARKLVPILLQHRLWDVHPDGGWQVHDYLDHNASAADVLAAKAKKASSGAKGGRAQAMNRRALKQTHEHQLKHVLERPPERALESLVNPSSTSTSTSTSASAGVPRAQALVQPRRKDAAFEGPRVYVPQRTHNDFIGLRNHPDAERELFTFYEEISEIWTHGAHRDTPINPDMIQFWKARYAEKWPFASPEITTSSKANRALANFRSKVKA